MRRILRLRLTRGLWFVLTAIFLPILSEFGVQVAAEKGWYNNAGQRWDVMVSAAADFVTSLPVLLGAAALAGLVFGLWLDTLLARKEQEGSHEPTVDQIVSSKDLLPEDDRREFASFVLTKLENDRAPCVMMFMKLTRDLFQSRDRIIKYVGHGAARAQEDEVEAWDALKLAIVSGKTLDELEDSFIKYYETFIMLRSWILRAAFTLGDLDRLRETAEFRNVSEAHDKAYSDVREFVLLRPRLRSAIEPWPHIDMNTHIPE